MTSNEPGTPTAAGGDGDAKPDAPQNSEQAPLGGRITQAGREKSAQIAEQAKSAARDLSGKAREAAAQGPKRSWGAVTAAVAAGAGIVAGWVVRRRRSRTRRSWWSRLRRTR
jgi:hypothetical protein